jgi:hypothetical protein
MLCFVNKLMVILCQSYPCYTLTEAEQMFEKPQSCGKTTASRSTDGTASNIDF